MEPLLTLLIVMALIATVVSLGWGVGSMGRGGTYDAQHSEQLMNYRVASQGVAVALLLIALLISAF